LKQASLAGYSICPVDSGGRSTPVTADVEHSVQSARGNGVASSDLLAPGLCYDSDVQLLPPHSSSSNIESSSKPNLSARPELNRNAMCRPRSSPRSTRDRLGSFSSARRRRASTLCVVYGQETRDSDEDRSQTTRIDNVSTANDKRDMCPQMTTWTTCP